MTLFKKVFQNQSCPATDDEVLDEDALRAAFTETDTSGHPLALDPFEHTAEMGADEEPHDEELLSDAPDNLPGLEAHAEPPAENEDTEQAFDQADAQDADKSTDDAEDHEPVNEQIEAAEEEVAVQSDEEIAAFLDRAMAAEPEGQNDDDHMAEAQMPAPQSELSDAAVDVAEEAVPEENMTTVTDEEASEDSALDVAAFAQQQMASLKAVSPAPVEDGPAEDSGALPEALDLSEGLSLDAVPAPATGRAGRRAGRVKTRLLGFNRSGEDENDPFGQAPEATATAQREKYPVGWLVIVEGPGIGHSFSIFTGASMIGRGEDQVIRLDFGDNTISRHNHAAIAYDEEENKFYIGHGGKSNIIRRNARPVLTTEELHHADLIRIGETTLRFVALCGSDFQWQIAEGGSDASSL